MKKSPLGICSFVCLLLLINALNAQTIPVAQSLPYTQDFLSLTTPTVTTYPVGWQGWQIGNTSSSAFRTTVATSDLVMTASGSAASASGGVYNFGGRMGFLASGSLDPALCLVINTTAQSSISVTFDIGTMRNPYNNTSDTRRNNMELQFRVGGASGAFVSLTGSIYRNNTTGQTTGTNPQNSVRYRFLLPAACDGQAAVQLRWVQRDSSGTGNRPSFMLDNVIICAAPTLMATVNPSCAGQNNGSVVLSITGGMAPYTVVWDTLNTTNGPNYAITALAKTAQHPYFGVGFGTGYAIDGIQGKELKVIRGVTYGFSGTFPNHPFHITTSSTGGSFTNAINSGTTNNFLQGGILNFTPNSSHADSVWYMCGFHFNMGWKIRINNGYATQNLLNAKPGTYTAVVSTADGCISNITVTVGSIGGPTVTVSNNGPKCLNDSTQLSATGGGSYSWTGPNGFTSALQNPKVFNSNAAVGSYKVVVSNSNGCTKTDSTQVSFLPTPSISFFTPDSGYAGESIVISGVGFLNTSSVKFNGLNAIFSINNNSQITATVPSGASFGPINILSTNGCAGVSLNIFRPLHTVPIHLRIFVEGFYQGGGMVPVLDPINNPSLADTITVLLYDTNDLSQPVVPSVSGVIDLDGFGTFVFPESVLNQSYYIVIKHRNSIESWSKNPVFITGNSTLDLTIPE